jgi:hypothetical protein
VPPYRNEPSTKRLAWQVAEYNFLHVPVRQSILVVTWPLLHGAVHVTLLHVNRLQVCAVAVLSGELSTAQGSAL